MRAVRSPGPPEKSTVDPSSASTVVVYEPAFPHAQKRRFTARVVPTPHEYTTAERPRADYWRYVAFDCATQPRLVPIQDPIRLGWGPVVWIEHYRIGAEAIQKLEKEGRIRRTGGSTKLSDMHDRANNCFRAIRNCLHTEVYCAVE
jgi:hypothetical protein